MTNDQQIADGINALLDGGNAVEAAQRAGEAIDQISEQPRTVLRILDALDKQRNDVALTGLLTKIEGQNILPVESLIFSLRAKFRAGDYPAALRLVNRILELSDRNIEALRVGGRIGNLTKDDDVALRYWERLARSATDDAEAALQSARIRLRRKQYAEALTWARQAIETARNVEEALQIAVQAGNEVGWPEECDALLARLFSIDRPRAIRLASSLAATLDPSTAARVLSVLRRQLPNNEAVKDIADKAYAQWLVAGMEQELASRDLDAATYYCAMRRLRPGDADARRAIDRLSLPSLLAMREAFNTRDFSNAIEHGRIAMQIDPECLEALQAVGRAQFSTGNIPGALESFRRCTDLSAKDARIWLTYGIILNQSGDRLGALTAFQSARQYAADPEVRRETEASIGALYTPLLRDAGEAAEAGDIERAWQGYDAAVPIRPGDAAAAQLRDQLLRKTRDQIRDFWNAKSAGVVSLCRQYLEQSPNDTYVQTVLARTLMNTRAYAEALPIWESLCARTPNDGSLHLQVARCCRALKRADRGIGAAQEALRLDPSLQEAAEVAEFLKGLQVQSAPAA